MKPRAAKDLLDAAPRARDGMQPAALWPRPGSVTSTASRGELRCELLRCSSSSAARVERRGQRFLALVDRAPAALRALGRPASHRALLSCAVIAPFLPSRRTRICSRVVGSMSPPRAADLPRAAAIDAADCIRTACAASARLLLRLLRDHAESRRDRAPRCRRAPCGRSRGRPA